MKININIEDADLSALARVLRALETPVSEQDGLKVPMPIITAQTDPQTVIKAQGPISAGDTPKGPVISQSGVTLEELRQKIVLFCQKDRANKNVIQNIFNTLGVASLSEVKPEDYNKLTEAING